MKKEFTYQHRKIAYEVYGSGYPVILLHGFGEDGTVWKHQVDFLKPKYRVFVPDLPGSGDSELNDDMTMEGMAETVHSLIHEENLDRSIVIGHSMGGYVTLALAEKYWNHLDGFGLFHSTAYPDSEEKKANRRKGIEFIKANGAAEFLKAATPNLFSEKTRKERPEFVAEYVNGLPDFTPSALVAYYEAMIIRPDRTEILKRAMVPVFFLLGETDSAISFEDGLKQSHFPTRSTITILRDSGHLGMLEETEKANAAIENFLALVLEK